MSDLKMPDVNSVIIAGHLTCDPSFRKTTNGTPVANFYITCNRKFKDNNIKLITQQFVHPEYRQLFGGFISHLSVMDLLFNHGPESPEVMNVG